MRVLALRTYTDCENKCRSLEAAGHEVSIIQYDDRPHDRHGELVKVARRIAPDAIVFIGAVEEFHGRPVPNADVLCRLRDVAPSIHMCNDAADPPWWPELETYHARGCFDVQVSIDGSFDTPLADWDEGLVLLTPIDDRPFERLTSWELRTARLGMCGGFGIGERGQFVAALRDRGILSFHEGPDGRSYNEYADLLGTFRAVFNHPSTGSGTRHHVKGRAVEAGYAGCVLFEKRGSPLDHWFEPGIDYVEYDTVDDVAGKMTFLDTPAAEGTAARFRERVLNDHSPYVFWDAVFAKALASRS